MNIFNKKTIIIFSCLLGLPIILLLFLALLRGCSKSISYDKYQNKMVSAAKKYSEKHNKLPLIDGDIVVINLDTLENEKKLDKVDNIFKNQNCTGNVTIRKNGEQYLYIPDLKCDNYQSEHLIDKLMTNVVESGPGLYKNEDGFVFKGKKVNNYVSINKKIFRIISIDNNNILKLVSVNSDGDKIEWDKKYNIDLKQKVGKNNYADSNIYEVLNDSYSNFPDDLKKHFVAYDLCIGKRYLDNDLIDYSEDCSVVLPKQHIGLMNVADFAMASYDPDCTYIGTGACQNYNYLYNELSTTWLITGVKDNSYEVYYYSIGYIYISPANNYIDYNYVVYVDGNEIVSKGDGSYEKPYVLSN